MQNQSIDPCVSDLYKYPVCVISVAVIMAVVYDANFFLAFVAL